MQGVIAAAGFNPGSIGITGQIAARDADHARPIGELPGDKAPEKRRQQLAHGQIAGAAEKDQIEGLQFLHQCMIRYRNSDGQSRVACLVFIA